MCQSWCVMIGILVFGNTILGCVHQTTVLRCSTSALRMSLVIVRKWRMHENTHTGSQQMVNWCLSRVGGQMMQFHKLTSTLRTQTKKSRKKINWASFFLLCPHTITRRTIKHDWMRVFDHFQLSDWITSQPMCRWNLEQKQLYDTSAIGNESRAHPPGTLRFRERVCECVSVRVCERKECQPCYVVPRNRILQWTTNKNTHIFIRFSPRARSSGLLCESRAKIVEPYEMHSAIIAIYCIIL